MKDQLFKPEHFINRELSWLEFNARVLEEARDRSNPLLERVKFLGIFTSNLDEFFMVRVAGLREEAFGIEPAQDHNPDGLRAFEQLSAISTRTRELIGQQYTCFSESVRPLLAENQIQFLQFEDLKKKQRVAAEDYFIKNVFPVVTPMAVDPSHPRPRYHNRAIYLAAMLRRRTGLGPKQLFAVVQLPQVLPRLIPVESDQSRQFIFLEDLVASQMHRLFGGYEIISQTTFRVTRDGDLDLIEQEADDMLRLIEERLKARQRAEAVRLEVPEGADAELVRRIIDQERLHDENVEGYESYSEVYRVPGPLDLTGLLSLLTLPGFEELREKPFVPSAPRGLRRIGEDLFDAISRRDVLLHHPFDAFDPVVDFITRAATDPKVLAIKQTLYRTSGDSPIIRALVKAAEQGKHVTALVELKARFDEAANVEWARQLERSGVHVVYGFMDLKTHCKVSMVIRQEESGSVRYVHIGTGNYNPTTAMIYTDLGIFTTNKEIVSDVSALFNMLTGYSQGHEWQKLVVAPTDLQRRTIELIEEQAALAREDQPAAIFAKLNSLVDHTVIEALYRASQAGVTIQLVIRGICCLRPGVPEVSENIHVRSIVDRFLEHSRILVFGEGEQAKVYFSSADWMPRNFYRRVESMFPVESESIRKRVLTEIIPVYLSDNVRARILNPDGMYSRPKLKKDEPRHRSQEELLEIHRVAATAKKLFPQDRSPS